jgi:hypothetical protein
MADLDDNRMECEKACRKIEVPTDEELKALNALRAIKTQVRDLKSRIYDLTEDHGHEKGQEIKTLENQLASLKEEWIAWEGKRKEAARIRMIMLGHEDPS